MIVNNIILIYFKIWHEQEDDAVYFQFSNFSSKNQKSKQFNGFNDMVIAHLQELIGIH